MKLRFDIEEIKSKKTVYFAKYELNRIATFLKNKPSFNENKMRETIDLFDRVQNNPPPNHDLYGGRISLKMQYDFKNQMLCVFDIKMYYLTPSRNSKHSNPFVSV